MADVWRVVTFLAQQRANEVPLGEGDVPSGEVYFPLGVSPRAISLEVYSRATLILQSKSIPVAESVIDATALVYKAVFSELVFSEGDVLKDSLGGEGGLVMSLVQSPVAPVAMTVWVGLNLGGG